MKRMPLPFKDFFLLTFGTLLVAVGVYFFKFPNDFSTGGVERPFHPAWARTAHGIALFFGRCYQRPVSSRRFFLHQLGFWRSDDILHASLFPLSIQGMESVFPSLCPHYRPTSAGTDLFRLPASHRDSHIVPPKRQHRRYGHCCDAASEVYLAGYRQIHDVHRFFYCLCRPLPL